MKLIARIKSDLDAERRARGADSALLGTLFAEAARVGKDAGNRETEDGEALSVVRKFIKNSEQTIADLAKAGRDPSASAHEVEVLRRYLPAGVPESEVEAAAWEAVEANGPFAKPAAATGIVVKALKDRFGDRFDGPAMMPVVKRVLG